MTEHERGIATYKENLSAKSTHPDYPHILWIQSPYHDNFSTNQERFKFNRCLEEAVKFHSHVSTLPLKKVWDAKNGNLYIKDCQRFATDGYLDYWEAVDRTVHYCDSIMLKKQHDRGKKPPNKGKPFGQKDQNHNDRFRWQNPRFNTDVRDGDFMQLLPPPRRAVKF